mmetsp:Transcript_46638/g.137804  ORF Transcript_46638/g.137804 Transcript_46638/m.137804 type:complete len:324 (+) Transcript_46638:60-1031(+)
MGGAGGVAARAHRLLALVVAALPVWASAEPRARVHMATFTTRMYLDRFAKSLAAKEAYARHWGYTWEVFDEASLSCADFRPHRWRGDYRYCKLEALEVMRLRLGRQPGESPGRDYVFWHDVDTHIMRPETPLESFLEAAGHAPVVFTDNALSLNNGVFFLDVAGGADFLQLWRRGCSDGEWPWADNGCMYEVLLRMVGGDRYGGRCGGFREPDFDPSRPEPPTGAELMTCFNEEMDALGVGCCGKDRAIEGFAFLTGAEDSFNHHPCEQLERSKDFAEEPRAKIRAHCHSDGMFMAHTKDDAYADASHGRVQAFLESKSKAEL